MYPSNPSPGEAKAGKSIQGHSQLHYEFKTSAFYMRPCHLQWWQGHTLGGSDRNQKGVYSLVHF